MSNCHKCGKTWTEEGFYPTYPYTCRACLKSYNRERYQARPDVRAKASALRKERYHKNRTGDAARARRNSLKRLYGLSEDDYDELLRRQDGKCAICKKLPFGHHRLVVDHDHVTGQVRGLLHNGCNVALGWFEKNTEHTIDYLSARYET